MPREVVVTGLGCVTPLGAVESCWAALREGRSGIGPLTVFDATPYRAQVAGQARDFDPAGYLGAKETAASSRCGQLAAVATRDAIDDAALSLPTCDRGRVGVFIGTSIGPLPHAFEHHAIFLEKGISRVHPLAPAQDYPGSIASDVAIRLGIRGPVMTVSTACTSGADAVGLGLLHLRAGVIDVAIVGGSEAPLAPMIYAAFDRLALLSRWRGEPGAACRPFALGRDGIALSEGAAICVLETRAHAERRNARILVEVAGFAATCDAHHALQQLPSGEEAARAMQLALADARVSEAEVEYISAHGTGTVANDVTETRAIRRVFGERAPRIPISSIKSMTGHLMGACGALEFVAAVLTIVRRTIPPTANLHTPDPECDLDYVPVAPRRAQVGVVLSNTFGFGARNAALVVREASR
jgi:3-oxoacyl-[acyl-carrier-protein] synthase II